MQQPTGSALISASGSPDGAAERLPPPLPPPTLNEQPPVLTRVLSGAEKRNLAGCGLALFSSPVHDENDQSGEVCVLLTTPCD